MPGVSYLHQSFVFSVFEFASVKMCGNCMVLTNSNFFQFS